MDKKLESLLKISHTPPNLNDSEADKFINSISYPKAKVSEVFISQVGFIRKRVWFLFVLSLSFAFFYSNSANMQADTITAISAILPFISLCTITEIHRSVAYNMDETELVCKYNLPKLTLIRIGILGTAGFLLLLIFVIIVNKNDYSIFRNTIYLSVPYLLSSYVSLLVTTKYQYKETTYVCAIVSGIISVFLIAGNQKYQIIYSQDFTFVWVVIFIALVGLLSLSLANFTKLQKELKWSLQLID